MMEITKETRNLTFLKLGKDRRFYKEEREREIEAVERRFQKKLSVTPIILHRNSFCCCYIFQHDNAIL